MSTPRVETHLPELMTFVESLTQDFESGVLTGWPMMKQRVEAFFDNGMMEKVNTAIPGWQEMAAYADKQTLIHVTSVLTALLLCPEYRSATPEQQAMMVWIVVFHDLAKQAQADQRDCTHGFRSAAMTGKTLHSLGFAVTDAYDAHIEPWAGVTMTALTQHGETAEAIQDNRKLPEIVAGIDRLFGAQSAAALVVKGVLLHMSLDVVADWPQTASLTQHETRQYIDGRLLPLLKVMMLVDNDAWSLFDPATKARYRDETLAVFERIQQMIVTKPALD